MLLSRKRFKVILFLSAFILALCLFNINFGLKVSAVATVSPTSTTFNKSSGDSVAITLAPDENTLESITYGGQPVASGNYTNQNNVVTFLYPYLRTLPTGDNTFTFNMSNGEAPTAIINITDNRDTITAAPISIDSPVGGGSSDDTVDGTGYGGTISWSPTPDEFTGFEYGTVYTATIELGALNAYKFPATVTGFAPTSGVSTATVTRTDDEHLRIVVEFNATAALPTLTGTLSINVDPNGGTLTPNISGLNNPLGSATYTWSKGGSVIGSSSDLQSEAYWPYGEEVTLTVSYSGNSAASAKSARITVYHVDFGTPVGNETGDNRNVGNKFGKAGDQITLSYTLADVAGAADSLSFSGVASPPATITGSNSGNVTGTTTYTIVAADANASGYIRITPTFSHIRSSTVSAAQSGGDPGTADTTAIVLTFDPAVTGLTSDKITITNGTGSATKGTLEDTTWTLGVTGVSEGNVTVTVADFGNYDVNNSPLTVAVYKDTAIEFTSLSQISGYDGTMDTDALRIQLDKNIDLTADDITITGASKDLGGSYVDNNDGLYAVPIHNITVANGETVTVTLAKAGYTFSPASQTAVVYKNPNTPVIEIITQPAASTTVTQGSITGSLSVEATLSTAGTLTYMWAMDTSPDGVNSETIVGATAATLAIPTDLTAGTYYFTALIVFNEGGEYAYEISNVVTVIVQPAPVIVIPPVVIPTTYSVTITDGAASPTSAAAGTTVTIIANEPAEGMVFDGWTVLTGGVTLADPTATSTTFTMGRTNVSLAANYKLVPVIYTITVVGGTSDVITATADETVTITAETREGYEFTNWTITGNTLPTALTLTDKVITFKPQSNITATATFKEITTPSDPSGGGGSGSGGGGSGSGGSSSGGGSSGGGSSSGAPSPVPTTPPATGDTGTGSGTGSTGNSGSGSGSGSTGSGSGGDNGGVAETFSSGKAQATLNNDGTVNAAVNPSGSLNSAATVAAVEAAAEVAAENGEEKVTVNVDEDVKGLSAGAIKKIVDAVPEGITPTIAQNFENTDGELIIRMVIPLKADMGHTYTGVVGADPEVIEAATAGTPANVIASFETNQKKDFGTDVRYIVNAKALGLDSSLFADCEDFNGGKIIYVLVKGKDGSITRSAGLYKNGQIIFESTKAGTMMISTTKTK
ncbi:MAG: hypothetical protein LBM59_07785 [Ruminococcus sp.]|jgi:uncharacterized membrane protein YgcG|nr:hypothetical protein [Ruminococcus sp.]